MHHTPGVSIAKIPQAFCRRYLFTQLADEGQCVAILLLLLLLFCLSELDDMSDIRQIFVAILLCHRLWKNVSPGLAWEWKKEAGGGGAGTLYNGLHGNVPLKTKSSPILCENRIESKGDARYKTLLHGAGKQGWRFRASALTSMQVSYA